MRTATLLVCGFFGMLCACTPAQLAAVRSVTDLADRVCVEGEDWRTCLDRCDAEERARGSR